MFPIIISELFEEEAIVTRSAAMLLVYTLQVTGVNSTGTCFNEAAQR